jgi:hypothetical protein
MIKKRKETNILKEPGVSYIVSSTSNTIHFFNSIEEQEADNYQYLASLSPEQHLENATALIKRIFATELKKNKTMVKRITFD